MNRLFALLMLMLGWVLFSTVAHASGSELMVHCKNIQSEESPDISSIEVYGQYGEANEVYVTKTDGTMESYYIDTTGVGVEASLRLPDRGQSSRALQNRHTGWAITTYTNGLISHEPVDCQ